MLGGSTSQAQVTIHDAAESSSYKQDTCFNSKQLCTPEFAVVPAHPLPATIHNFTLTTAIQHNSIGTIRLSGQVLSAQHEQQEAQQLRFQHGQHRTY